MQVLLLSSHDEFTKRIHVIFFLLLPRPRFVVWPPGKQNPVYIALMVMCTRYTDDMKERVPSNDSGGQQRRHTEEKRKPGLKG